MLRAAIVGLGWWGKTIVARMKTSDRLKVTTAVEIAPDKYVEFARENGLRLVSFQEMLADPAIDAVVITTPNSLHVEQTLASAGAGKHVFCEKPLALTLADAKAMVAACKTAGVVLGVGHERRFEPAMAEVERLVRSGELGVILHAEAAFSHDKLVEVPEGDWRRSSKESPAAGMTAMGIHLIDAFVNLFGPVKDVYAATAHRVLKGENGDVVSAICRHHSGPLSYLNANLATPLYLRFAVFGREAWVEFRNGSHPDTIGDTTFTLKSATGPERSRVFSWTDSVKANLEAFANAAERRAPYPFTTSQKLETIAVLEAAVVSAATGQATTVRR